MGGKKDVSELASWFLECRKALQKVMRKKTSNNWGYWYDVLFPEQEWKDSDPLPARMCSRLIDFKSLTNNQKKAYENILKYKCIGLDLDTPLYHYTTLGYLNEAIRHGGFLLSLPKDWSVNWEDTKFKNTIRSGKDITALGKGVGEGLMNYSYAMCWSLDENNHGLLERVKKNHPGEPVVILESNARKLLSAYITDNLSVLACSLVRMKYLRNKQMKELMLSFDDLQFGDAGTEAHHDSISMTNIKFSQQKEVRLIYEVDFQHVTGTTVTMENHKTNKRSKKLIVQIDLRSAINSVRVVANDYLFTV